MSHRVKVIAVSGINNRVFKTGDLVTDSDFPLGEFQKRIDGGYIVPEDEFNLKDYPRKKDDSEKESKKPAVELIEEIEGSDDKEWLNELLESDTRKTVQTAIKKRIEELG